MQQITYAGDSIVTTDEVATVLVKLTDCLAKKGIAEAVTIPIILDGVPVEAKMVVGVVKDVLSVPSKFDGDLPDFSDAVAALQDKLDRHTPGAPVPDLHSDSDSYLPDYPDL